MMTPEEANAIIDDAENILPALIEVAKGPVDPDLGGSLATAHNVTDVMSVVLCLRALPSIRKQWKS